VLGSLRLVFPATTESAVTHYRRELDLSEAIARKTPVVVRCDR